MIKNVLHLLLFLLVSQITLAQVGIGTVNPDASSILDVTSIDKGFLPPRVANTNSISNPATGLLIYNLTENCIQVNTGTPSSPSWTCMNTNGGSNGSSNSSINLDCEDVFKNISSFGARPFKSSIHFNPNHYKFTFFLNSDGSKLYNTRGFYYDSTPGKELNQYASTVTKTANEVLAVSQKFPNIEWKEFFAIDEGLNANGPTVLYLLSKTGDLKSMQMTEKQVANYRLGFSNEIFSGNSTVPPADPDLTFFGNFTFQPMNHYVNDVDQTIKFDDMYPFRVNSGKGVVFFLFSKTTNKFYSFGGSYPSNSYPSSLTSLQLMRDYPSDIRESFMVKEATYLNDLVSHFNTEIVDHNKSYTTFIGSEGKLIFITKDNYVNYVKNASNIERYKLPNGVKPIHLIGGTKKMILGDDGKVYYGLESALTFTNMPSFTTSSGTINHKEANLQEHPYFQPAVSNIKSIYLLEGRNYLVIDQNDKPYNFFSYANSTYPHLDVLFDLSNRGIDKINRVLAIDKDIITETDNGNGFLINMLDISSSNTSRVTVTQFDTDFRDAMFSNSTIDIDGKYIIDPVQIRNRLFTNCINN
ncbi:MAG: hypothetical protein ACPGSD_01105 [Flavobacteriales bacterium]